ncbi:YbaB/EbfC family nucleoid-associated protein [Amycolatopsis sp. FDAARGOS 1241]|uniref:YbaB/EbfC family nucleoid-associated protein n=1 Tax=Amycolatopsis sp. FDAARGOS 1241 TaxID=2778070 RepID=UPI00194F6C8F|nr:YbaB/EbfC family nucleoid-associated protein [Amycolatopsis sp. FDAARGOS 1241]QRP46399.1 YbaB/EbfC family nucleoid-associated protein [Amycolatopsis sp. FDAARGOS 1241]
MNAPYQKMLEEALGAYQRQRQRYDDTRKQVEALTTTVTSARREVTATVSRTGELTDLSFPTPAYKRMAPAELASVIVKTVEEARQKSIAASAEALAPMLPPGLNALDLMNGRVDVRSLFSGRVPGMEES